MHDFLRQRVNDLANVAIAAADPRHAVNKAFVAHPLPQQEQARYKFIAIGKAASAMMEAALTHLPAGQDYDALIVTNYENAKAVSGAELIAAGHPVPDENGLKAGERVEALLSGAGADDHVICLISGGGSALLPAPAGQLSLDEKADISRMLLSEGFDITEMNGVRQCLSRLKGGGMLRMAAPAPVTAFILSDVVGDDMRVIASGPTAEPITTNDKVVTLLKARGVYDKLPDAAKQLLQQKPAPLPENSPANYLVGSNRMSLDAMLVAGKDEDITLISDNLVGDVSDACAEIVSVGAAANIETRQVFIWGGETTVALKGSGKGGRNQELALRVALAAETLACDWAFGSVGTDGRDGPTDAAGGIVDGRTASKIRNKGLNPEQILAENNSYFGLQAAGDLLKIGATGTNVADIQILVCQPRQNRSF